MSESWSDYLRGFHDARSGITEDVLADARDDGRSPYDWLVEGLAEGTAPGARVVDVAGGSGAIARRAPEDYRIWTVDNSPGELARARASGLTDVVEAAAARLPFADGTVDAVTCSMALMLVPWSESLREIARVLKPEGRLVATVPTSRPLSIHDSVHYGRLLLALRTRLQYPNDDQLRDADASLSTFGFELQHDDARRFALTFTEVAQARRFLDSLYLRDVDDDRLRAAERVVERWQGVELGVPVRRLVARRSTASALEGSR